MKGKKFKTGASVQKNTKISMLTIGMHILLMAIVSVGLADEQPSGLGPYFGTIPAFSQNEVSELRSFLKSIDHTTCGELKGKCPPADQFYDKLMGDIKNPNNPKLLVYIDENQTVKSNMIIWKNRVTPYLFDAQNIWVTIFSEKNIKMETILTILFKQNTFSRFGQQLFMPAEVTKKERETRNIVKPVQFRKIGKKGVENNLWLGIVRYYLEPETAVRISISPTQSNPILKKKTVTIHESGDIVVETQEASQAPAASEELEDPGFYAAEANFTNSRGGRFGLSAAIGATFGVDEARKNDISLGNTNLDLYLCGHLYLIRPIITESMQKRGYQPSVSIMAGTSVDVLSEIVVGVSVAHLFGKNGISAGVNIMDPFEQDYDERQFRGFVAFDIRLW